jgi:MFS family permease
MATFSLRRLRSALKGPRRWLRATVRSRSPRRLRRTLQTYRGARRSLHAPVSRQSRRGLDWMNFFLADVQTGFGSFVAFYLADLGWSKAEVGLALTTGTLAGVVGQVPGGALTDSFRWKRALAAIGIIMIAVSALILALVPTRPLVFFAEVLHGLTAGIVTPAIAAISLGLVGRRAMSARTGRNYRFDAAGNALTAWFMGLAGDYFRKSAIFLASAALCIPALFALSRIKPEEIDYARARNAGSGKAANSFQRIFDLGKNRKLYIFAACVFLFQFADASMLPIVGENLAQSKAGAPSLMMSGLIVAPQIVVSLLSPWVGYHSERFGRKPLLILGFVLEIPRALLFAFFSDYPILVIGQLLDGISGATVTVLTILVITDITTGTGRFNLARGVVGTLIAIAASISTAATGFLFQSFGHGAGFFMLAAVAAAGTLLLWLAMPETKPAEYLD